MEYELKFKLEVEMKEHKCIHCEHKEFLWDICRVVLADSGSYRHIPDSSTHPEWCPLEQIKE